MNDNTQERKILGEKDDCSNIIKERLQAETTEGVENILSKTSEKPVLEKIGEIPLKRSIASDRISNLLDKLWKLLPNDICNNFLEVENVSKQILYLLQYSEQALQFLHTPKENSRAEYNVERALSCAQAVLDHTWEQLNTGHWRDVPLIHRHVYSIASLLKILSVLQSQVGCEETVLRLALKAADMGLLLGAPLPSPYDCLDLTIAANSISTILSEMRTQENCFVDPSTSISLKEKVDSLKVKGLSGIPIMELNQPSLEKFQTEFFLKHKPVKLKGCMTHWPALKRWRDLNYLERVAGARTVPIELGSHYAHTDYSQKLMTVGDFIEDYVTKKNRLGYLAQHQLFDQVPELKGDIYEPEYCCLSDDNLMIEDPHGDGTDINAWFGPAGTVSPLHFDPKHNLLAQVVGSKRILLFAPEASPLLYPHEERLLHNTAQVDPEQPDFQRFPRFQSVDPPLECHLDPGDMLYIPPRFWHHVRALSTSFSVSFWWK